MTTPAPILPQSELPNIDISSSIMEQIQDTHPKSKLYADLRLTTIIFGLVFLVTLSSFALALFAYDIEEQLSLFSFAGNTWVEDVLSFLFELLLVVPLGILGVYLIYRHTDWKLAKDKLWIVVIATLTIIGLSSALVVYTKSDDEKNQLRSNFSDIKGKIRGGLPFHRGRGGERGYRNRPGVLPVNPNTSIPANLIPNNSTNLPFKR